MSALFKIWAIAQLTFIEAVRQRFFYVLLLIGAGMLLGTGFFQQFDFGTEELKFIMDFGFGTLFFLGSLLAITSSAQLFYSEIENRTALTLLAKPVRNSEFLVGKFLGIQLLMLSFVLLLSVLLVVMLWWREAALGESTKLLDYADVWCYGMVQWGRFGILCAISLMIGSFARSYLFTLMLSFLIMMVGQLQYLARDSYVEITFVPLRWLVQGLGLFFPNLQLFNIGDQLGDISMGGVLMLQLAQLMLYAAIYWVAYLSLAWWVFRRREI